MPAQADKFRLFPLLPTEIRLKIWRSAFTHQRIITVGCWGGRTFQFVYRRHPPQADSLWPQALLLVNHEAHDVFISAYEPFYEVAYFDGDKRLNTCEDFVTKDRSTTIAKSRKRYINKSQDTACVPSCGTGVYPHPSELSVLGGVKYLDIDRGMQEEHITELLIWRVTRDTYSRTDPKHISQWIPDIRSLQSSLEMVTFRPLYQPAELQKFGLMYYGAVARVYEPPEDWMKREKSRSARSLLRRVFAKEKRVTAATFTTVNLPFHHNENMLYMCEALAFALGMGKDPANYRGPKIVAILATMPNHQNPSIHIHKMQPDRSWKRYEFSDITWKLPDMNRYTKCNYDKPSPSTWAQLEATQPKEWVRSAREVDAGGDGLWCIREVVGFDIDKEVTENPHCKYDF